jgi:hypothetical protein
MDYFRICLYKRYLLYIFIYTGSVIPTGSVASIGQASQLSCYFEDSDCGYTNSQANDFNWTRNSGPTSSRSTGPHADHTYGTKLGNVKRTKDYIKKTISVLIAF